MRVANYGDSELPACVRQGRQAKFQTNSNNQKIRMTETYTNKLFCDFKHLGLFII